MRGELLGGNALAAVFANKHDSVACFGCGKAGDIHDGLVHADTATHWAALAVDEDLGAVGEAVSVAVGVSDWEDGDTHGGGRR